MVKFHSFWTIVPANNQNFMEITNLPLPGSEMDMRKKFDFQMYGQIPPFLYHSTIKMIGITAPTAPMRAFRRTCANGALLCANGAPHAGGCGGALCAPPPLTTVGENHQKLISDDELRTPRFAHKLPQVPGCLGQALSPIRPHPV